MVCVGIGQTNNFLALINILLRTNKILSEDNTSNILTRFNLLKVLINLISLAERLLIAIWL